VKIALVARLRPVHVAHAALLEALCDRAGPAGRVVIGIGSSNRYGPRNPFTAGEVGVMVDALLAPRHRSYELLHVPDLGDGPRWRAMVRALLGELLGDVDLFVTANPWVAELMTGVYPVAHPRDLVPRERHAPVSGELVRRALARGGDGWRGLVPPAVARVLVDYGLVERFRREFGLATLALETTGAPTAAPTVTEEMSHVLLG
jgi:nicotinamide-nucleotide adenylyltransferase